MHPRCACLFLLLICLAASLPLTAQCGLQATALAGAQLSPQQKLAREVFEELIEINTTESAGSTRRAAEAMAARLRSAGFAASDVEIVGPEGATGRKANLIARLRGSNPQQPPILMLAHMDVVEARKEDWSTDPFKFVEQDGFFYGRGTADDKADAATIIVSMMRWKQAGWTPERDVIAVLTTDEELDFEAGIAWLAANRPDLLKAEYALNMDGGGVDLKDGRPMVFAVQAAEKVYADYEFKVLDAGGHSSRPKNSANPIYRLAAALERLAQYEFPPRLTDVTRQFFEKRAAFEAAPLAADLRRLAQGNAPPEVIERVSRDTEFNATLRTTCTATMVDAGHANNALPQMARAVVNCRILPDDDVAAIERQLRQIFEPAGAQMRTLNSIDRSPSSPLNPELVARIAAVAGRYFPGAVVMPVMSTGATDAVHLRAKLPVYGVSGKSGEASESRAHGKDERIGVKEFYRGLEFWHELIPALAGGTR